MPCQGSAGTAKQAAGGEAFGGGAAGDACPIIGRGGGAFLLLSACMKDTTKIY